MAGIFYLPRIFVHYVEGRAAGEDVRRLQVMARKLYHFTSMMAVFALASGIWLWQGYGFRGGWLHAKLAMVVLLIAYHISMRVYMKRMQVDGRLPSSKTLRWYNELPSRHPRRHPVLRGGEALLATPADFMEQRVQHNG